MKYSLFFLLLFMPMALAAEFCETVDFAVDACRISEKGVSVDILPKELGREFVLTFTMPDEETTFQDALGIRSSESGYTIYEDREHTTRFWWYTLKQPIFVKIYHKDCVGKDYRFTRNECLPATECDTNDDCPSGDACTDGFCRPLACSPCERLENHMCIEKCVDDSLCTTDSCDAQGACSFVPIKDCCSFDEDCTDKFKCTTEYCDATVSSCVRGNLSCANGPCIEPTGCLSLNDQWSEHSTARWTYKAQALLIMHPMVSAVLFSVLLGVIVLLIIYQTSEDFKHVVRRNRPGSFVEPHKRKRQF